MKRNYIKPICEVATLNTENLLQTITVSVNGSYPGSGGTPIEPPIGG